MSRLGIQRVLVRTRKELNTAYENALTYVHQIFHGRKFHADHAAGTNNARLDL